MKRLSLLALAIVLLLSSALAEPITYNSESNTITFDIASMPTSALKAWLEALDPSYAEYKNIETMVFKELSKRGEIAWISQFKSNSAAQATTPTQKPSNQQINGVFVPDFQYFMETFFHHSQHVDREMSEDILENCKDGDTWIEHEGFFLYGGYDGITIRIVEGNGYLDIVKITIDKKAMETWDMLSGLEGLSENLKAVMRRKTVGTALITQINAQNGATNLAATTICTAGKTFVGSEGEGDAIYLYVYENACPAAVSFVRGEDNSVSASGTFILNDGFDASSPESLEKFFGESGAVIESVPLN